MKVTKTVTLVFLLVLILSFAVWAYFQPGFVMDLANKFVFC